MSYKKTLIGFEVGKKTPDGLKQPVVNNEVILRPINRQKLDITNWRNATISAESQVPRRVTLYDLYADILTTDAHVISVWSKRVDAVTSADWQFTDKDGNPVDAINELLDCIGFEDLLAAIIDSKLWGYTMVEPTFLINTDGKNEFTCYVVPRKHMRPEKGIITKEQTGDTGINVREGIYAKTMMEVGKTADLGLLLSAAQYAIYKRGDVGDWAEFIEIFGRGIIDATWDGFDQNQRIQLSKSLKEMGGGGIIIRPAGTTIDIKQNTGNANGQLQQSFAEFMNKEISKVLLGSTETVESSGSSGYAQSKTHESQDVKKNDTDITFARRILNSRFIKILKAAGFDTKGGSFTLKSQKKLTLKEAFEVHLKMVNELKLPFDHDFFYEEYGMPKPKDYELQLKAIQEANKQLLEETKAKKNADTPPDKPEDPSKQPLLPDKQPAAVKLSDRPLLKRLFGFFQPAPAVTTGAEMKALTKICCGNHLIQLSLPKSEFNEDALYKRFYDAGGSLNFDAGLFNHTAQTLLDGLNKGWHSDLQNGVKLADLGFAYGVDDPALLTAFEQNLFRFSASKTLAEAQELNRLFRSSTSFEQFLMNARIKMKVFNAAWLETEYNTAYLTGEAAATYSRLMKQVKLFPYWEYKTVGDDKVRAEHRDLYGLILPANDPIWKKLFPPNGWNCRCYIVPRMKTEVSGIDFKAMRDRAAAYFDTEEFKTAEAQGWGVNRADSGEVFTQNQFYIKKFADKASKLLNKLGAPDYDLPSYSQARKVATADMPKFKVDARSFYSSLEKVADKAVLRDYHNRPLGIAEDNFNKHTSGKKETRVSYLDAMVETLKKPDEVWYNGALDEQMFNNVVYLKYYKDETMIVLGNIENGKSIEVATWFSMAEVKKVINKFRRGLLIFSKK